MNYYDHNSRQMPAHSMGDIPAVDDPLTRTIREAITARRRAEFEAEYVAAQDTVVVEHVLPSQQDAPEWKPWPVLGVPWKPLTPEEFQAKYRDLVGGR